MTKKNPNYPRFLAMMITSAAISSLLLFSGCSPQVSWISAEPKSVELNKMDETVQLRATALDKTNKPVADAVLAYVSSNPKVATVDDKGLVKAKGTGQSTITVTSANGERALVQVKVALLKGIKVEPAAATLKVGEKVELKSMVLNERDEPSEVQSTAWATSDASIAFIDDMGTVTAIAPGEVTITCTTPTKDLSHIYGKSIITVVPVE